jgi:3-phosphoshikimate 1-carboxyvinyltransferase
MTMGVMSQFGVVCSWEENRIVIPPVPYRAEAFTVEADWSAASYYFVMAALSREADLTLEGLFKNSLQGDAVIVQIAAQFGVRTEYTDTGIRIIKEKGAGISSFFEHDFLPTPDLAQGVAVMLGGLGCPGLLTGLQTLRWKETDRIQALQTELARVGVFLSKVPGRFASKNQQELFMLEGKVQNAEGCVFDTYEDHRMAMAMACLGILFPVFIANPQVVTKSYPDFWNDLKQLDFAIISE